MRRHLFQPMYEPGIVNGEQRMSAAEAAIAAANAFVGGGAYMTVSDLLANFPASTAYVDKYANVLNLFKGASATAAGGIREVVRCRFDAANGIYSWVPQRNDFNVTMNVPSGTITMISLVTPPTIRVTGNLLSSVSFVPPTTNLTVGEKRRIVLNGTLGTLVNATVQGLVGGSGAIVGGGFKDIEYAASGWFASS